MPRRNSEAQLRHLMPARDRNPTASERPMKKNCRKVVHNACENCRAHKAKCSGSSPCHRCQKTSTECIFTGRSHERVRQDLQDHKHSLNSIFDVLRLPTLYPDINLHHIASQSSDLKDFLQRVSVLLQEAQQRNELGQAQNYGPVSDIDIDIDPDNPPNTISSTSPSSSSSSSAPHPNLHTYNNTLQPQPYNLDDLFPTTTRHHHSNAAMLPPQLDERLAFSSGPPQFALLPHGCLAYMLPATDMPSEHDPNAGFVGQTVRIPNG